MNAVESPRPENLNALVWEKITRRLHSLANSPMKEVSVNAQLLFDFIFNQSREMDGGTLPSPTMTSDLRSFPMSGLPGKDGCVFALSYKPMIKINTDNLLTGTDRAIEADLVRTSSLIKQLLLTKEGFSPRLRTIYGKAIKQQVAWLEQGNVPPIPDDPRTTPREKLLRKILGEERYLGDAGYRDWQRATDIWLNYDDNDLGDIRDTLMKNVADIRETDQQAPILQAPDDATTKAAENLRIDTFIRSILKEVRNEKSHFLFIREDLFNTRSMRNKHRKPLSIIPGFQSVNPSKRAIISAYSFVFATLQKALYNADARKKVTA